MRKMTILDRVGLLATGLLAAYQVVVGVEGTPQIATWFYTIAFGVLLIAGLLLIIFGFEALDSSLVVIVAALFPLSLSVALVFDHAPTFGIVYLIFALCGLGAIALTRYAASKTLATMTLAFVHAIAALVIVGLPIALSARGATAWGFGFVSLGGAFIGIGGLLLTFLKTGKPLLSRETILVILPALLLVMTAAFVIGLAFG
ncbi:MAG: hypothetical protein L0Y55_21350 [Anaerolineales bacterium]|nr:hypothetical protein [Anaerolineales bacterium]